MSKEYKYNELSNRIDDFLKAEIKFIESSKFVLKMLDDVKTLSKMWDEYPQMKIDLTNCYTFINATREFIVNSGLKDDFNKYMNNNYGATLYRIMSIADRFKGGCIDDILPF